MVTFTTQTDLLDYPTALSEMERHVAGMIAGTAEERVWLVEHEPLYTGGTSANVSDLLSPKFPVYDTGRGGEYTYHGPGQRVAYAMLDLKKRHNGKPDIRHYVWQLEEWIITTLAEFGVLGERREGRVGIWVVREGGAEEKIAAIGIRVRKWMTFHGIAINVNPDLSHFGGIVPCGIKGHGVTSLAALGRQVKMKELDAVLQQKFEQVFA